MKRAFAIFLASIFLGIYSCSKSDSDTSATNGSQNTMNDLVRGGFTISPLDSMDITALVPLGNLNPPGHVFPTDHMYFYCYTNKAYLDIKSPGNIHVIKIDRTHYNAGLVNDHYDYSISLGSDNSYMYWNHVSKLSARLLLEANNFTSAKCDPSYASGGSTFEQCHLKTYLTVSTGEILGTANSTKGLARMDMGTTVIGVSTNPLEYFDANSRNMLENKLGRFDGKVKRTALPICGEIIQDITATAQGNWLKQGLPKNPEDNHIALVKDNIDSSKQAFSVGVSIPGLPSNVYYFNPQSSGFTNRHFAEVKPDGNTYCYTLGILNFPFPLNSLIPSTSVIIKMENGTTLSVEKRNCDCTCAPYTFTSNKATFTR